ncbi:universal stress protein [Salarchaeum sp. III]|uniref:universal stress protein n=1 Tax=Salarchaeum sp. III TaxID=3107927 RepID=UPI002EDB4142
MSLVVVPVRYPLTEHSKGTLEAAIEEARERDADLTILHVNLYQDDRRVTRTALKHAVERAFGPLDFARYVVRRSFLVEQAILDEVAGEDADVVVIGHKQMPRWRRTLRRLFGTPDIESFLRAELDCELISVPGR